MKNRLLLMAVICVAFFQLTSGQAPRLFNYQAVVRDAAGTPVANNTPVRLKFIIHQNAPNGTAVFTETQTTQANEFGLISAHIGDSSALVVNWAGYDQYLEVDADVNLTGSFTQLGISRLISVPYALDAANADNGLPNEATNGYITMVTNDSLANSIITENAGAITINGGNTQQSLWIKSTATYNAAVLASASGPFGYVGSYNDASSMDIGTSIGNSGGSLNLVTQTSPRLSINGTGQIGIAKSAETWHQLTLYGDMMIRNSSNADVARLWLNDEPGDSSYVGLNDGYMWMSCFGSTYLVSLYLNKSQNDVEAYEDDLTSLGNSGTRWTEVWATNGVIQTSDERLKKNISELNLGLPAIMQLKPVSYEWKNNKHHEGAKIGFIAQQVENIIPQAVIHSHISDTQIEQAQKAGKPVPALHDPYGMNYSEIIPVLVKGIQDQQHIIDAQNRKMTELLSRIEKLEGK